MRVSIRTGLIAAVALMVAAAPAVAAPVIAPPAGQGSTIGAPGAGDPFFPLAGNGGINVSDYGLADRINLLRSDLFRNLPDKNYDLIVSNPPYVTARAMDELPAEYRHEPALALAGGDDGLDAVRTIMREAPRFLAPRGLLVVEIGHNRDAVEFTWPRTPFVWLDTGSSADSVFLLTREEVVAARVSGA